MLAEKNQTQVKLRRQVRKCESCGNTIMSNEYPIALTEQGMKHFCSTDCRDEKIEA